MLGSKKGGYFMIDSLSDEQILELANHYITTDESLDNFQSMNFKMLKNNQNIEKVTNMKARIDSINQANNSNNKFPFKEIKYVSDGTDNRNTNKESKVEILNIDENIEKNVKTPQSKSSNKDKIQKALEYYNNIK